MPMLLIRCPLTGEPVPTGISMDARSFQTATLSNNSVGCPHCRQVHVWNKEDVLPIQNG